MQTEKSYGELAQEIINIVDRKPIDEMTTREVKDAHAILGVVSLLLERHMKDVQSIIDKETTILELQAVMETHEATRSKDHEQLLKIRKLMKKIQTL
jgi:hypothetical protein